MSARFQVMTCRGYRIRHPHRSRGNSNAREGLSATVCDSAWNFREIKTYRSEDEVRQPGRSGHRLGVDGALAAAKDHARYLNRLYGAA